MSCKGNSNHFSRGMIFIRSCSIFTGLVFLVRSRRCGIALHVGVVYHYAFMDVVTTAQNDVRCFARRSRDGQHLGHGLGNLSAEIRENFARCTDEGLGLVVEESSGPDGDGEFRLIGRSEVAHGGIFLEQPGRYFVYPLVGALRR